MQVVKNINQDITLAGSAKVGEVYVILGTDSVVFYTNMGFITLQGGLVVTVPADRHLIHKPKAVVLTEGTNP